MKQILSLVMLVTASILPNPVIAQTATTPDDEDDGQICILIGYRWNGSPEETGQIQQSPVPKSFMAAKGGACGDAGVDASHLIKWHLRYGSEDSVRQALHYIEKRDTDAKAIAAQLDRDFVNATAELEKQIEWAYEQEESDHSEFSNSEKLRKFIANGSAVSQLGMVKNDLNRSLLERINLYLSAAEIFKSQELAGDARELFGLYQALENKMLPTRDGGGPERDSETELALEIVQDSSNRDLTSMEIALRLAVLRAQLDPKPETFEIAKKTLAHRHQPAFDEVSGHAFDGGDDFCDLGDWHGTIAAACKGDHAFVNKAMAYGYADAMLAILTDSDQHTFDNYVTLYEKDRVHDSELHSDLLTVEDRVVNLKLALADRHFSKAKAGEKGQWSYEEAWRLLTSLAPMVNPAQNPVRFRQIAERAIVVDAAMRKDDKGWKQGNAQMLSYFLLNLENLDRLANGELR